MKRRKTDKAEEYIRNAGVFEARPLNELSDDVQQTILSRLTPRQMLDVHAMAGWYWRTGIERNMETRIINGVGQDGFNTITNLIPPGNISYMRHLYTAYVVSNVAFRDDGRAFFYGENDGSVISFFHADHPVRTLTFQVSWDSSDLRGTARRLTFIIQDFRRIINNRVVSIFFRTPALPLRYETTLGMPANRVTLIMFLLYLIENNRFSVDYDELVPGRPIRNCISCNIQKAKFTCKCHMKEYCGQDCANKNHL